METSRLKVAWFVISTLLSFLMGGWAYVNPHAFYAIVDLFIPVIAIFFGALLAIIALLGVKPKIGDSHFRDNEEKKRIESVVKNVYDNLIIEQTFLFLIFYIAIILSFSFKIYYAAQLSAGIESVGGVILSSLSFSFGFFASFSLVWSSMLPILLRDLAKQRNELN